MPVMKLKVEDGYRPAAKSLGDAPGTEKSKFIPPSNMYGGFARLDGDTFRSETLLICAILAARHV